MAIRKYIAVMFPPRPVPTIRECSQLTTATSITYPGNPLASVKHGLAPPEKYLLERCCRPVDDQSDPKSYDPNQSDDIVRLKC